MTVVGITGRAGSGKSAFARYFAVNGYTTIDCDEIAHGVLKQPDCKAELVGSFGADIVGEDGEIVRKKLGEIAFSNEKMHRLLERITHKHINKIVLGKLKKAQMRGEMLVFLDIPLLVGYPLERYCDRIIVIRADAKTCYRRLNERSGLTAEQAKRLLANQLSTKKLCAAADVVIDNDTTQQELYGKAGELLGKLLVSARKNRGKPLHRRRIKRRNVKWVIPIAIILLIAVAAGIGTVLSRLEAEVYRKDFSNEVYRAAAANDLDADLIFAIIKTESDFNPQAVSSVGARGLMQITEDTFEWIQTQIDTEKEHTYDDMFDPAVNIEFGSYYYKRCLERYSNDISTAAAAYHSGWGTVDGLLEDTEYTSDGLVLTQFPYEQMNLYVHKILTNYASYKNIYGEAA